MKYSHIITSSSVDCYGEVSSVLLGVGSLEECVDCGRIYLTEELELSLDDDNVNDQLEMSNWSLYIEEDEGSTLIQIFVV